MIVPVGVPPPELTVAVKVTGCRVFDGLRLDTTTVEVDALFTTWAIGDEVLALKLRSPKYFALIPPLLPASSDETAILACPAPFNVPVPNIVGPISKLTVPVGIPDPGATATTVAMRVTDCPNVDGLGIEAAVASVSALLTACDAPAEVLVLKLLSPAYAAVNVLAPALVRMSEHVPAATVPVQLTVPSVTVTLPVGVPPPGAWETTV